MTMELAKRKRALIRSSFTRIYNSVDESLKVQDQEIDNVNILANINILEEKVNTLQQLDEEILNMMLAENVEEAELDSEVMKADEYKTKFKILSMSVNHLVSNNSDKGSQIVVGLGSNETAKRKFKLPILELTKFSGEIKDWLKFWGQFRKIDEDLDIDEDDKFQYLLQATEPNTRAREVVVSFPPIGSNYKKALESLKSRFGREELLVEYYVRELLKLTLSMHSNQTKLTLSSLYDKVETQLRALETLGVATDNYAAMLFPLVESCLSEEVLRTWQRSSSRNTSGESTNKLNCLMVFLKSEVENEERISLAVQGFGKSMETKKHFKSRLDQETERSLKITPNNTTVSTAANLINFKDPRLRLECLFCKGPHQNYDCFKAQDMTLSQKRDILAKGKSCFACLKVGHLSKKCRTPLKCIICGGKHVPLMCDGQLTVKTDQKKDKPTETANVENNLSSINSGNVYLQTLIVKTVGTGEGNSLQVRVLMDPGSQRSYIQRDLVEQMKYEPNGEEDIIHGLFGNVHTKPCHHKSYKVRLMSMNERYHCNFDALDEPSICSQVPVVPPGMWVDELKSKGIVFHFDDHRPIQVLIGADIYGKLLTGKVEKLQCGLVAIETHLGWMVTGKMHGQSSKLSMTALSMFTLSDSVQRLWELDVIGIQDPYEKKSREEIELEVQRNFLETVNINDEGRYEVQLPWIEGHPALPRNFELAKSRLKKTVHKLDSTNTMCRYDEVLNEWKSEGIIEEITASDWDTGHYLPHRPVFKENSTTKVRPVFDASSKEKGYPSLNECLHKGVNLLELIPSLLIRFRMDKIGVIADIRKAFLQISLASQDRDFLRFLWVDKDGNLKILRHTRVVFGVSSSPFLLGAVMNLHLNMCLLKCKESKKYNTDTIERLQKSFYVDNCVTSLEDRQKLKPFIEEASDIFSEGKFDLRGWEYTDPTLVESTCTAVLGLQWDRKDDMLSVSSSCWESDQPFTVTRRQMLSVAQRIFDPIGVTCPITLCPKLMLQETWMAKCSWDEEVGEGTRKMFLNWLKDLSLLNRLKIPRWLLCCKANLIGHSIHTFCDASAQAYATAVFLRVEHSDSSVSVQLVLAKNRVAPIKTMTIPRLELMAATIGARLTDSVRKEFDLPDDKIYYWSDSSVVIAWITRDSQWGVFVRNRVNEIRKLTNKDNWHHLPGNVNPADLPSRGCSVPQLIESRWWEGPPWLKMSTEHWPSGDITPDEDLVESEKKRTVSNTLYCESKTDGDENWYYYYSNNFHKVVRTVAWIDRFLLNCRNKPDNRLKDELSLHEINQSEKKIVKMVQRESFSGIDDVKIKNLCPFLDEEGIIRIKTKVIERKDVFDFRFPAVLPHNHPVVEMLVLTTHNTFCHVGTQGLLSKLRERYWLLKGRRSIRNILLKCVQCRRYESKPLETVDTPLPELRVREAAVFEITGVDFCGPLYLQDKSKVWICLYTCAVYRAVHLELTSLLSTNAFIQTFRRFIARRGRPSTVFSDNGKNFVGTENALQTIDWEKIVKYSQVHKIEWRFNPPMSAWWGGWWERLIKLLKQLLKKTLGKASVTREELETILCDCEAVINARPLTYISESPSDLTPITPDMFLHDLKETGVPDFDVVDSTSLTKRIRYCQKIKEDLRRRFRNEYLGQLVMLAKKKTREIDLNEVVLIENENSKRIDWPLALVEKKFPGRDGETRLVKLRTATGVLLRPIQRVFPLEIRPATINKGELNQDDSKERLSSTNEKETFGTKTRCGRKVKLPSRFLE